MKILQTFSSPETLAMNVVEKFRRLSLQLCSRVIGLALKRNKYLLLEASIDQQSFYATGEERGPDHFNTELLRAAHVYRYMLCGIAAFLNRVYQLSEDISREFRLVRYLHASPRECSQFGSAIRYS